MSKDGSGRIDDWQRRPGYRLPGENQSGGNSGGNMMHPLQNKIIRVVQPSEMGGCFVIVGRMVAVLPNNMLLMNKFDPVKDEPNQFHGFILSLDDLADNMMGVSIFETFEDFRNDQDSLDAMEEKQGMQHAGH